MERRLQSNREDFVEEFVELEQEKVWDAYLSIDVSAKDGKEEVPEELVNRLETTTQFLALEDYFSDCKEKCVCLTDDVLSLNESHDLYTILHAVLGKEIDIHLRVSSDRVSAVEKNLEKIAYEEASKLWAIIKWKYIDDGYMIQFEKRIERFKEFIFRIYPDGRGVIVNILDEECRTSYLRLSEEWMNVYKPVIERKVRDIISKPQFYSEDDRYHSFSAVLWYGVMSMDKEAYATLNDYQKYEVQEFGQDEYDFRIIKSVLSIPGIKELCEGA